MLTVPLHYDAIHLRNGDQGLQIGFALEGNPLVWLTLQSRLADDITIEIPVKGEFDVSIGQAVPAGFVPLRAEHS